MQQEINELVGDLEGIMKLSLLDKDLIDLAMGPPPYEYFPIDELKKGAIEALTKDENFLPTFLQYGNGFGSERFRKSLSKWINYELSIGTKEKDFPSINPQNIFITNGCSHGLDLVSKHFANVGDTILVEEVTYFLTFNIFKNYNLKIVPVKLIKEEGICLEDLANKIDKYKPSFIYIIPTYHNPTGITISTDKRKEIINLIDKKSKEFNKNIYIVADEVYQFLYFYKDKLPPLPMWAFDDKYVISLNSFSKLIAPGLRLGWICSRSNEIIEKLDHDGVVISGGGFNPFTSHIVYKMIENGDMIKHCELLRNKIRERAETLSKAIKEEFKGIEYSYLEPEGGYFIWVVFSKSWDKQEKKNLAMKNKTAFKPGKDCAVKEDECLKNNKNSIRLCFAHYNKELLVEAAKRLAKTFK